MYCQRNGKCCLAGMEQKFKPKSEKVRVAVDDQNAATQSYDGDDNPAGQDEDNHEEVDPHPDTPDDFDEDAVGERESIEAVIGG
ncbi:MAG TPA: hypothetical protein VFP68_02010 [Burkholderiaceae bacterium]|nr:hypothetical protein [Burkholderiaceae bacterium]